MTSKSGVTKNIFKPGTYAGFPAEPARGFGRSKQHFDV